MVGIGGLNSNFIHYSEVNIKPRYPAFNGHPT